MIFLDIVIALMTLCATLAAFGGDTWIKGSDPLLDRITRRGWISLVCLVLTFCLGISKEIVLSKQNRLALSARETLESNNSEQQTIISAQVSEIKELQLKLNDVLEGSQKSAERLREQVTKTIPPTTNISINTDSNLTLASTLDDLRDSDIQYYTYMNVSLMRGCSCMGTLPYTMHVKNRILLPMRQTGKNESIVFTSSVIKEKEKYENMWKEYLANRGYCGYLGYTTIFALNYRTQYESNRTDTYSFTVGAAHSPVKLKTLSDKIGHEKISWFTNEKTDWAQDIHYNGRADMDSWWNHYVVSEFSDQVAFEKLVSGEPCGAL